MPDIHEELSSVAGWTSIACWIIVYTPQIIINHRFRSGEGLSALMLLIWTISDLCNSVGAVLAGLLPTVIIIAFYKFTCDATLLGQLYYYRWARQREVSELAPLITSHTPTKPTSSSSPKHTNALYTLAVLFVLCVGMLAWYFHRPSVGSDTGPHPGRKGDVMDWRSQVVGWISALLNVGSRVPQIVKNRQTKCAGLAMSLFIFAVSGNFNYFCSILIESTGWNHLLVNFSWLVGSGGAVALDCVVVGQFLYYRQDREGLVQDFAPNVIP